MNEPGNNGEALQTSIINPNENEATSLETSTNEEQYEVTDARVVSPAESRRYMGLPETATDEELHAALAKVDRRYLGNLPGTATDEEIFKYIDGKVNSRLKNDRDLPETATDEELYAAMAAYLVEKRSELTTDEELRMAIDKVKGKMGRLMTPSSDNPEGMVLANILFKKTL